MGKKFLVLFGISILIFMITSAIIDMNKRSDSIEKNKYETVAKVYKFHSNRSFNTYYFEYFYDGKKYRNSEDIDYGTRVIGYLKRVSAFSAGRRKEHNLRHYHRKEKASFKSHGMSVEMA